MPNGLFITGTDTEIGKTVVSCALARAFRDRGIDVGVMKPVACGAVRRGDRLCSEDALALRAAAGVEDDLATINPVLLEPPLAPVPASRLSGQEVAIEAVDAAFRRLAEGHGTLIVEGVGGALVPIVRGFTVADLAARLGLPVLVVARPDLGTVNHTLLTIEALQSRNARLLGVVLNDVRPSADGEAERTGPAEIEEESGVPILGRLPFVEGALESEAGLERLAAACERNVAVDTILQALR